MQQSAFAPMPGDSDSPDAFKEAALGVVLCEPAAYRDQVDYAAAMVGADGAMTWAAWDQGQQLASSLARPDDLTRAAICAIAERARSQGGVEGEIFAARYNRDSMTGPQKDAAIEGAALLLERIGRGDIARHLRARQGFLAEAHAGQAQRRGGG